MNSLATVTGFGLNGYKRGKDVNGKEILIPKIDPWRRFMEVKVMQVPGNPACLLKNVLCVVPIAKTSSCPINQNLCQVLNYYKYFSNLTNLRYYLLTFMLTG